MRSERIWFFEVPRPWRPVVSGNLRPTSACGRLRDEEIRQWERDMRTANVRTFAALAAFLIASRLFAQNAEQPAYLNASLPAEQRAADLVHRMTMEEKVTQLVNQSRAVPR